MALLSTTLTALRQGFLRSLSPRQWYGYTTGADGNVGGTTLVDATNLVNFPNDKFNTWWVLLTSGTYSGQIRRVSDFVQSTGTVTVSSAFGGKVVSGVTYELCPFHPTNDILPCLNVGLLNSFPNLGKQIVDDSLIAGNWLPNGHFTDWDTASHPNQWVASTATAAKETAVVKYGSAALKLTGGASSGYAGCEAFTGATTIWNALMDMAGYTATFKAWAKTDTASHCRLGIVDSDGTTYSTYSHSSTSGYHSGDNLWQLLVAQRAIAAGVTSIAFRIYADVNTKIAYVDRARAYGPTNMAYVMPQRFTLAPPTAVAVQSFSTAQGNEDACDDHWESGKFNPIADATPQYDDALGLWLLRFHDSVPTQGYTIRLQGTEYMATLSAETDTIPFNPPQTYIVYAAAAAELYRTLGKKDEAVYWESRTKQLRLQHGIPLVLPARQFSWSKW